MSITANRATMLAIAGTFTLAAGPLSAQVDPSVAANIMVECAKIDDATARLACYDNNIRNFDPTTSRTASSRPSDRVPAAQTPQRFGIESIRAREEGRQSAVREINAVVASARERQPGVYVVALEDGAEWVFTESVGFGFRPPRRGQTVEIERGALGSFLMEIDDQQPVPVRRLR